MSDVGIRAANRHGLLVHGLHGLHGLHDLLPARQVSPGLQRPVWPFTVRGQAGTSSPAAVAGQPMLRFTT